MANQPNIEIGPADTPRPVPEPEPPRRWRPRPGVVTRPEDRPVGGPFGTPAPDAGWALKIIRVNADRIPGLDEELEAVLNALMVARASLHGRAPVPEDLEVALILCGIGEGLPEWLSERRRRWLEAAAEEIPKGRTAVSEVDPHLLAEKPDRVRWVVGRHGGE